MTTLDGSEPVRDGICLLTPSAQTQVDVFGGQWAFELPLEGVITGVGKGFANPHPVVHMAEQIFGSLEGMSCLELGPFEGEISYAGPGAENRARLAAELLVRRMPELDLRVDLIGVLSLFGDDAGRRLAALPAGDAQDVRLRVAAAHPQREVAERLLHETNALYCCGPAGGGGVRTAIRQRLNTMSCLVPRELVPASFDFVE